MWSGQLGYICEVCQDKLKTQKGSKTHVLKYTVFFELWSL